MMLIQHHKASEYYDRAIDQFEQIYEDAEDSARVMAIGCASLHHGRAAPPEVFPPDLREHPAESRRGLHDRRRDSTTGSSPVGPKAPVNRSGKQRDESPFRLLNGLTFAALLFVVASGFTLIFGLLRIVNLAHGALYLFGGYIGYTRCSEDRQLSSSAASAPWRAIAAIGFVLDQGLLRFVRGQ